MSGKTPAWQATGDCSGRKEQCGGLHNVVSRRNRFEATGGFRGEATPIGTPKQRLEVHLSCTPLVRQVLVQDGSERRDLCRAQSINE